MNGPGFTNFYLNSTRVGTRSDLECFYYSWYDVYGCSFNDSTPWGCKGSQVQSTQNLHNAEDQNAFQGKRFSHCNKSHQFI